MDMLAHFEGLLGGYLEATDKLKEARFFLELMKQTTNWDQFRWLTSAFLSAARSAMDWLATSAFYAIPGDEQHQMEPDEQALRILGKHFEIQIPKSGKVHTHSPCDLLLKKLCNDRNETVHSGPIWIKPEKVADPHDFRFGWDDTPVLEFAESVIDQLSRIQTELRPDLNQNDGT